MEEQACYVCYGLEPPLIPLGCGCRGLDGVAHVNCIAENAGFAQEHRGDAAWTKCQQCNQPFTGAMWSGLAAARWSRVRNQPEESAERLLAARHLASSLSGDGKYADAERIDRQVLDVRTPRALQRIACISRADIYVTCVMLKVVAVCHSELHWFARRLVCSHAYVETRTARRFSVRTVWRWCARIATIG